MNQKGEGREWDFGGFRPRGGRECGEKMGLDPVVRKEEEQEEPNRGDDTQLAFF